MFSSVSQFVFSAFCIYAAINWKYIKNYIRSWYLLSKLPTYDRLALPLVGHAYLLPKPSKFFQFHAKLVEKEQRKGIKQYMKLQ